jgi:hypothetical protein
VERTITDPTLTSTYEAFQGGTNTKQDLLYPYSFFEEDVMTAINRLSKILQDNLKLILVLQHLLYLKKLEAKIKVLTQSIVRARAAFFRLNMPAEVSKVDVKEISTQLGIFSMWAKVDLNPAACSLIAQLEPGNTSTEITLPDSTMELYNLGYSESITDALYKAALIVKTERCGYKKTAS